MSALRALSMRVPLSLYFALKKVSKSESTAGAGYNGSSISNVFIRCALIGAGHLGYITLPQPQKEGKANGRKKIEAKQKR